MLLQKEKLQHLNSIAHEGKVVVFATDANGKVHYTIKQDGFEDSYLNTPPDQRTGWEQWKLLEFPNEETDDASVVELETEDFTRQDNGEFLVRSRYKTQNESAVAPVQLVSGVGHIYVFRQSKENTLFCDRFVLDGMTNELTRKLEVRFKRSRQKHQPTEDMRMGASGLQNVDSLDYRDTNNQFFYEPTTELQCINNLQDGWFSVVQVPTNEHDKYRWHIFAYNSASQKVQLTTIRTDDEGLFDLKDYTVLEPKSDKDAILVPRSIPGMIQRTLDMQGVAVTNGLAATKYDIQQEQETKAGPQLMRTSSKVMLVVPTDKGTAALSFAIAGDGTLSQIDPTPQNDVLRSTQRDVLLPLNTLEQIKAFGDTTPPPQGTITGFSVGTEADNAEDLVKITSPEAVNLASGEMVEIQNTTDYNGLYSATKIDEDTFTIELPANEDMGNWEAVEAEGGLIFDGMVTAYEKTADGKLKVTASNHGLENGDEVLLKGTQDYDNTYQVQKIDDANFVIQRQWSQSEAVNVKLESRKRRGIVLDGKQDYVDCGSDILPDSYTKEAWIKWQPGNSSNNIVSGYGHHAFYLPQGKLSAGHNGKWDYVREATANQANTWIHVAVTYDSSTQTMRLYKNGKPIDSATNVPNLNPSDRNIQIGAFNQPSRSLFKGCIADVRIWDTVRTEKEIQDSMYLQLTGKEVGLVGYWRLGAISEGKQREVVDFSVNGNNGIVHGDAYVGGVTLDRTLRDGMPAVKYSNDDLVAVSQRATYIEEFEFKVNEPTGTEIAPTLPVKDGLQVYLSGESLAGNTWSDLSGNQNHATEASKCDLPSSYEVTDYNGKQFKVARFTAKDGMILPDSFNLDKPFTAIIIDRYYGSTKGRTLQSRDRNWLLGKWRGNNACYMEGWLHKYPALHGEFTLSTVTLEGTNPRWYTDGQLQKDTGGTTGPGPLGFCKGGKYSNEVSEADIACVLIYDRVLSDTERQQVEQWLGSRYGISIPEPPPPPPTDVNNADGNGNQIFQLSYWGKASRSADEKITISAQQDDFASLGNGWYRAVCRFTIPDGVAMLRTFELADVRGTWGTLEIRKHYIRLISDAITEAKYGDAVSLTSLADNQASLQENLQQLEQKEREEIKLLQEKQDLEAKLAALADLELLKAKVAALRTTVNNLNTEKEALKSEYDREIDNPFNYYCHLHVQVGSSWKGTHVHNQSNDDGTSLIRHRGDGNLFRFSSKGNDTYNLHVQVGSSWKGTHVHNQSNDDGTSLIRHRGDGNLFRFSSKGNDTYNLHVQVGSSWKGTHVHNQSNDDGTSLIRHRGDGNLFQLKKTSTVFHPEPIANAEKAWSDQTKTYQEKFKELQTLENLLNDSENQKTDLENRLQQVKTELAQVQTELNTANTTFIDAVKTRQQVPQTMPEVATDGGNLVTKGALLGFVHPAGRLNAIETCEGNVQLTYFDDRGKMRQTLYDATSDRLNQAFEQWIPESLRTCLNFNNGSSVVKLNYPVYLGENSTIEAWFAYPFAEKLQWHILASSQDNEQQIVAYNGKHLGLRINGVFFDCGYDLEQLSPGWHHLTIATKQQQQNSGFYIDGEKVGITEAKPAVQLDGNDDYISLPAMNVDYATGFTIEAWVHYASFNTWSRIIDFGTGPGQGDIIFANKDNTDTLFVAIGGGYIEAPGVLEIEQWMHLAVTVDSSGNVTVYKDGLAVATGKASIPANIDRTNNFIGKSNWPNDGNWDGEIAEVRLWNLARTQTEIQENIGKTLKGDELGLVGYWQLAEGSAKDSSSKGYDGTIEGTAKAVTLSAKMTSNIYTIGNGNLGASNQTNPTTDRLTALKFDGSGDYIECGSNILTNSYTKEAWIQWESGHSGSNNIVSGYDKHAFHLPSGKLSAGHNGHWGAVQEATIYQGDTWIHVAVTYDSSTQTMQLYTNGKPIASATNLANFDPSDRAILIAAFNRQHKFKGAIAEVRVWNVVRTPAEIQRDMGQTLTGSEAGLIGYWPLRDGSAKDYSPNGNDGTIHGNPQTVPFDPVPSLLRGDLQQQNANQFGKLAEVRIWDIGLSDEEIAVNSKTLLSGNEPGLLAYYPMTEATGNEVRDRSANSRHAIMQGASWWGCAAPIGNLGHTVTQFDGQNDYIHIELNEPETEITHEFWFKTDSADCGLFAVVKGDLGANGHDRHLYLSGGNIKARIYSDETIASSDLNLADNSWHHLAHVFGSSIGGQKIYLDGKLVASGSKTASNFNWQEGILLGYSNDAANKYFSGQMAEVRIWKVARTPEQIRATMHQSLNGKEADLVAYWPLNAITPEGTQVKTPDMTGNHPGTVREAIAVKDNTLPIGANALISSEYNTIAVNPGTGRKSAMMRRFFASPGFNGAELLPEKRIEQLQLQWIGNAQFAPTLLGYIEGAPPIPSENLTEQPDYNGATSVELNMSEDVEFSWNRSEDSGKGGSFDLFVGADVEGYAGLGFTTKAVDIRAGLKGNLDFSYQFMTETNITSSSSTSMTDRLELRGTSEQAAKFPHLGQRFIPKNVGYALVISSLADVFISKLVRSGKMVGYQVRPVEGIPPDVNTITFLINPAYTMNGSLDGMTGSSATSSRFFKHVPEMRNQYGSLYPASYYRLQEAYNLKQAIEREDKRRESYFYQFQISTKEGSLDRSINSGQAPSSVSVQREEDKPNTNLTEEEKKAQEEAKQKQLEQESAASQEKQSAAVQQKQSEINTRITDQERRAHALDTFDTWQRKMENILIRAGKQNIVNTYVWDGDGGMRTEAQSFANTAQHTIGGSFNIDGGIGFEGAFGGGGFKAELTALATMNLTQTMNKTESRSKGIQLNVDLSGVEHLGITDYKDYPIQPGEKVDRYRFMSFYLEGSTDHFRDFFNYVVDPEWLRSNDEEARALRQAMGKANKTWRVLHRVTYVERPALMGFGRDLRKTDDMDKGLERILNYFDYLDIKHAELKSMMTELLVLMKSNS